MKKRLLAMMFAGVLAFGLLTGCGSAAETQNVPVQKEEGETVSEEKNEGDGEASQGAAEQKPAEDAEPYKTLNISDWGYENLWYLNRDYLMTKSEKKQYVIIDSATGERTTFGEIAFDGFKVNCQDGTFIVQKKNDDGTYNSSVCYFEGNDLRQRMGMTNSEGYFVDYRDGIAVFKMPQMRYVLGTVGSDGNAHEGNLGGSVFDNIIISYGHVIFPGRGYSPKDGFKSWFDDAADIKALLDGFNDPGKSANIRSAEDDGTITRHPLTYEEYYIEPVGITEGCTPNDEGWIAARLFGKESGGHAYDGFYNLKTGECVQWPFGLHDLPELKTFTVANGSSKCTVTDSKAVVCSDNAYQIFDLKTGDWASDKKYLSVGAFGYGKYVVVESPEQKWGYINSEDMSETEWFDDASAFCNGYAIVTNNGKAHLINEKFQQVSEDFEAKSAYTATRDYFEFSDLDGKSVFFAELPDGLYHMVTVE